MPSRSSPMASASVLNDEPETNNSNNVLTSAMEENQRGHLRGVMTALGRRKPLDERAETNLNRCLNLLDLTSLGVGSTLGLGLYVLAGQVASTKAGPAVVISFGLAALASGFSALCYAEFAGRVPKAGSAYVYSYITVGEFVAFIIGWNLILEYVIGASSVARGFSGYLKLIYDHVTQSEISSKPVTSDGATSNLSTAVLHLNLPLKSKNYPPTDLATNYTKGGEIMDPISATNASLIAYAYGFLDGTVDYIVRYFDWPSIVIVVIITIFILFGVKESTNVTLLFTGVNLIVVITVVISSFRFLDLHNWRLKQDELPAGEAYGQGGFMPFGWSGVLAGSATCFFGFIGFDTIASSAEEAKNPKRNLPISIILSLFISFIAYMLIAIVQTLMWPYYDQDKITILPYIFGQLGMPITYWIVLIGASAGLASSQMGGMYPLPRILYSMAQDKLIYACLAKINKRTKLPVRATLVGSVFIALLACLLDIQDLADMVSIGTLAAYSLVSISVLIVRYEFKENADDMSLLADSKHLNDQQVPSEPREDTAGSCFDAKRFPKSMKQQHQKRLASHELRRDDQKLTTSNSPKDDWRSLLDLLFTWKLSNDVNEPKPRVETCVHSKILISLIVILSIIFDIIVIGMLSTGFRRGVSSDQQHALVRLINGQQFVAPETVLLSGICVVFLMLVAASLMLSRLPTSKPTHQDMFLVPFVPTIPIMSLIVNIFLMLNLSYLTWVRFSVWMIVGFTIYFTYGVWNSEGSMRKTMSTNKK